jgi:hypothetical protein
LIWILRIPPEFLPEKVKIMVKLECFSVDMDPEDFSGGFPEKVHTPVGLFLGGKLDYFSVLYYGIGEISGIFRILPEVFPEKNTFEIRIGNIFRNFKTFQNQNSKSPSPPERFPEK